MGDSADELEQYCRKKCLFLHGVRESEGDSKNDVILETVKEKMDINGVAVYVGIYWVAVQS